MYESISDLRDCDSTFPGQLLLGLLAGVGVGEVRVEILVQHLARLFTKVSSLPASVEEPGAQDHDGLARRLLQLDLDRVKFLVNDVDHPLNLLGCDGPRPALLSQQIHHVGGELVAGLVVLLQLLVVDCSDLCELTSVVCVFDGCLRGAGAPRRASSTRLV